MENGMRKTSLLIGLSLALNSFAAVPKKTTDELVRFRSQVMDLGARLSSLEKEIGSKNNLYISSVEQIKQFEGDVKLYREKLTEIHAQLRQAQLENKKIVQSYLIESEDEATEAWQKKAHLKLLQQAQSKLKNKELELISFENKVAEFDTKLASLRNDEEELVVVIKELENRKKIAMELYLLKVQTKKNMESKVQERKLQKKIAEVKKSFSQEPVIEKKPDRLFKRPVDDFSTYTASAKGVTFKYQSIQPIKAVGDGKVVFAGDLASYGQVVLIDHGQDLRTVLLGKMDIKVKKNDTVRDGEVLAYTQNSSKEDQNLYFEVRKKNTAQNTILWLDQNGVSKI
jgi:murein DD-endopeptidase MepM/ murein hydrolase activator NlpD